LLSWCHLLWVGATFSARLVLDPPLQMTCTVCRVEPVAGFAVTFNLPGRAARPTRKAPGHAAEGMMRCLDCGADRTPINVPLAG